MLFCIVFVLSKSFNSASWICPKGLINLSLISLGIIQSASQMLISSSLCAFVFKKKQTTDIGQDRFS